MNGASMAVANSAVGVFANAPDKSKEFQMELLMERLRTKTSQYKTLTETSKAVRMTMLDKRWALDTADRAILQKCLDSLQHSIKVCSFQSLVERLECLSRQLGFKFLVGPSGVDLFISSDMFYLEILLEASGTVKDVKIHHEGKKEQQSCEELVSCISRGDFTDFTAQLEGLTAMYQLNADKKAKAMAFSALAALEADLGTLAQMQATLKDPWAQVHKSPIGFVQKRKGGHAMRLTYFVSPYEVARCPGGSLTAESFNGTSGAGHSVRVLLESAAAHKLQFAPLITPSAASRAQPNGGPIYAPFSASNCVTLPARFVLKLSQPMPICGALLKMMSAAAENAEGGIPATPIVLPAQDMKPLLSLVARHSSSADINPNKGLFVTLPDQNQCYFLTESRGLDGCMVESVPFTHPRQVSTLITRLRQQALFNALIASCVRPNSKQDLESSLMVEVSALSWQHISVSLEQPGEGGMATLELELPESSSPRVSLHGGFGGSGAGSASRPDEKLGRILARTLSIPLLVRALVMGWERERERERETRSGFSGGAGGTDPGGAPPSPSTHYNAHAHHPQGTFLNDPQSNLFGSQDSNLSSMMGNCNGGGVGMQTSTAPQLMPHQLSAASHRASFTPTDEKKPTKKRKHDIADPDGWSKKPKSQVCEVLLESSSNSSASVEESDQEEEPARSNSSNDEGEERGASPTSFVGFISDLDPAELTRDGSSNDNRTSCSEFENSGDGEVNDSQDMDDIIRSANTPSKWDSKKHKQKNREHSNSSSVKLSSSASLLMELTEGSSPAVSITPLSPSTPSSIVTNTSPGFSSVLGMRLDRRPGIEIIPISSEPRAALIGGSVTITPITPSQAKSMDERHRSDRKSGSSGKSSRDGSKDKKKKKRHEDSMGPPEKLPPKQDPLTKPVSVSIKPADGSRSPLAGGSPSPSPIGKFSPSPTHGRSGSVSKSTGSGSPGSVKTSGKPSGSSGHHGSPRHSPVRSSPKRAPPGYSSPKNHGTSSPKHASGSSGSGKPSMSALKSAAGGSPSSKSSSSSSYDASKPSKGSSGKESSSSSRDKDRKSSGGLSYSSSGGGSPKMKSSTVKLKQLDLSTTMSELHASSAANDSMISPGPDLNKSATPNQLRNRKGSLSAVIDKLKSAQHCSEPEATVAKSSSSSSSSGKDRSGNSSSKLTDSKTTSTGGSSKLNESKTQEYMVKPSSDGMKITFNKTRTKESSSSSGSSKSSGFSGSSNSSSSSSAPKQSSSSSGTSSQSATGTGSPKTHTGLKPGVISGPASKKPQALQSSKTGSLSNSTNPSGVSSGSPGSSNKISSNSLTVTGGTSKVAFTKSSSGSSLSGSSTPKSSSKVSTGSPKMSSSATDLSKLGRDREREREREKSRSSKSTSASGSSSDKSIFSSGKNSERRSSPAPVRDDGEGERAFKMLSQHSKDPAFIVEGLIKSLDTSKYQIPKLSARVPADDPNKTKNSSSSNDKTSVAPTSQVDLSNISNRNAVNDTSAKMLDYMGRQQDLSASKYSFQHLSNSKIPDQTPKTLPSPASSSAKPAINLTSSGPKLQTDPLPLVSTSKATDGTDGLQPSNYSFGSLAKAQSDSAKDNKTDSKTADVSNRTNSTSGASRDDSTTNKIDYSKPYPAISVCSADTINQLISRKIDTISNKGFTVPQIKLAIEDAGRKMLAVSSEPGMKPPPAIGKLPSTTQEAAEILLDFSSSSGSKSGAEIKNKLTAERAVAGMRRHTPPLVLPTQAPSLSVHIVKSPAPSPLIVPSPHSNSPCITDDELMDEAVVGPGK